MASIIGALEKKPENDIYERGDVWPKNDDNVAAFQFQNVCGDWRKMSI